MKFQYLWYKEVFVRRGVWKEMNEREENYDLLRIACLAGVIALHVGAMYSGKLPEETRYSSKIAADILHFATRFAVPCFVMLSGAFLLSDDKNMDYVYFYKKSARKLGIPLVIFSCFAFLYREAGIYMHNGICYEMRIPIVEWLQGSPFYHLWYMYMLTGLYLLVPVLIRYIKSISGKSFVRIGGGYMAAAMATALTSSGYLNWDIRMMACYLGYFLLGKLLYDRFADRKGRRAAIYFLCGIVCLALTVCLKEAEAGGNCFLPFIKINYVNDFAPLNVLAAVCMFCAAANMKVRKSLLIRKISECSYYIYLLHAFILDVIEKIAEKAPQRLESLPLWLLFEMIAVFLVSFAGALLIRKKI